MRSRVVSKKKFFGKKQGFLKNGMAYQWSVDLTTPYTNIGGSFEASYVGSWGLDLWNAKYLHQISGDKEEFELDSIDQLITQLTLYKEALIKADAAFEIASAKDPRNLEQDDVGIAGNMPSNAPTDSEPFKKKKD